MDLGAPWIVPSLGQIIGLFDHLHGLILTLITLSNDISSLNTITFKGNPKLTPTLTSLVEEVKLVANSTSLYT